MRALVVLALASVVAPASAAAQIGQPWQIELGGLGTYTTFGADAPALKSEFGGGGILGVYISRRFSLEFGGEYTPAHDTATQAEVRVTRLSGGLYAHTGNIGVGSLYLGAGYNRLFYRGAAVGEDDGLFFALGDRLSLGGRAAFRIEGRMALATSSAVSASAGSVVNWGAAAGLSIFAFGGPPRDADDDGVRDRADQCPNTPLGALVDANGCPTDADQDGVYDGLDRCADTPAGASVDATGCPSDADQDGVYDGIDVCPNTPAGAQVDATGCPTDADRDGVFDGLDRCPDTPQGAVVNDEGCPTDADGDGVFDGIDQCPNTPAGVVVDATGCPADSDGDGVVNALDQCPSTPAGTEVDAHGCPVERDSDADGVPDSRDRCPNTAPGQNIDAVGCPILFQVEQGQTRPLVLKGVNFQTGRSALTDASYTVLDEVAQSLLAHPDVRIEIGGYTDNTGSRATNMRLSLQRAQAVMAYLVRKGISPSRMVSKGYGPADPIATNATADGRAQNRRVELKLLEGGTEP